MSKQIAPNFIDLTGKTFSRLTVVKEAPKPEKGESKWVCLCSCGKTKIIRSRSLRRGLTKSCGCLQKELTGERFKTHGASRSPEYSSWLAMWQRCTDLNSKSYERYRDRKPPEIWRDFKVFLAEVGPKPSPKHTLERIQNHLPYGPGNVGWATRREQNQNNTRNIRVMYEGIEMTFCEACELADLNPKRVRNNWYRVRDMGKVSYGLLSLPKRRVS